MLQHVGHAAGAIDLVHAAHAQPDHVRDGGRATVGLDDERHAVGQGVLLGARLGLGRGRSQHGERQKGGEEVFHRMSGL